MDQKTEIRSYIKCRIRLNIDSKQIFNELCGIYGPRTISMCTVFRWVKAFKAGKYSVEDDDIFPFPDMFADPDIFFFYVISKHMRHFSVMTAMTTKANSYHVINANITNLDQSAHHHVQSGFIHFVE